MKLSWFWSFDTAFSCVFLYFGVCYVLLFKVNILVSYVLVPSSFRFQLCVCPLCPSLCLCVSLCLVSLFCFYVSCPSPLSLALSGVSQVCLSYLVLCFSPCVPSHLLSLMSVICSHVCVYYFQARVCLSGSHCICHFLSYFVMCVMFGFAPSVSLCLISCVSLLFLYPCYSLCKSSVSLCPGISLIPGCVLCLLV